MDAYDVSEAKEPRRKKKGGAVWNVLTIVVLATALFLALAFLLIYFNPHSFLNPFPPPVINPQGVLPNPTAQPNITLSPSPAPTRKINLATDISNPSNTPPATSTPAATSTATPTTAPAQAAEYSFAVREGSPAAIDGSQFHPDAGCQWSGVAGQATSLNDEPVKGLFVHLGGRAPGMESTDNISMTGLAPQYGQGGFEITLSDKPFSSSETLWIQLVDQQNLPLSDRVYFDTSSDCTKNLVIIYFDQVR